MQDILHAQQFHQGTDVGFLCGVNGICLGWSDVILRSLRIQCLHRVLRRSLNHDEEGAYINDDQRQDRFHDCLRGGIDYASATLDRVESAVDCCERVAGQSCHVVHCPFVQAEELG